MSKVKYKYNIKTLSYEKVQISWKLIFWRVMSYLATGIVFAFITIFLAFKFLDSPKEKLQKREIAQLIFQIETMQKKMQNYEIVLNDMQLRDDNIYRVIFEAEPIPNSIRRAGFGGVDRYKKLQDYENGALMIEAAKKLDRLSKQLYVQSKSFDEISSMVKNKAQLMACIPAIFPLKDKDINRISSGFGWRTHPITKENHLHAGIDLSAPEGAPIYAAGDGQVERADNLAQGYGNHVILNHGYGYQTLYGHMTRWTVRLGQKVKRGDLIGYVGSTGLSTSPHLHYEVIKDGNKIDPIHFFFNDVKPDIYAQMLELAARPSQSFD
jgi:murein DD-endopeptidase MepM/ murein hydrolase activator NlpD